MTNLRNGYVGVGGNLTSVEGAPQRLFDRVAAWLPSLGIDIVRQSSWYRTGAVGPGDQPAYINGVWEIATGLTAEALLDQLHTVEAWFGRRREVRWGARVIDLDLLALGDQILHPASAESLCLPHPRLAERAFVLVPLCEIAPGWRHPVLGATASELLNRLNPKDISAVNPA